MKKTIVLSLAFALISFGKAWSQSDAAPTAKPTVAPKDKTEQMKKAEEKSGGAAYSGKGKGGEKDSVEKSKPGKGQKSTKRPKKGRSGKHSEGTGKVKEGESEKRSKTTPPTDTPQPEGSQAPQPKKLEPKKKTTETAPQPKTGTGGN